MKEHVPRGIPFEKLHPNKKPIEKGLDELEGVVQTMDFDRQWENQRAIEIAGETFESYDIHPKKPKSETPVLIMDGWGSTPPMWKENVHALVESGRRTIGANAPHGIEPTLTPPEDGSIPEAELRRISAFMETLDACGVEKTDVIAHSQGGLDALLAANMYPERFRNLVMINPGGMIGPDTFPALAVRFVHDAVKSHIQALRDGTLSKLLTVGNTVATSAAKAPIRAGSEILAIARTQVINLLRKIKEQGVNIVIISGVDDPVMPTLRMAKAIHGEKEHEDEDIEKLLDGFYSVKGGHTEFLLKPAEYTHLAEKAITALEIKQKRIEAEKGTK